MKATLTLEIRIANAFAALERAAAYWPPEKMERFEQEWKSLQMAGAEISEARSFGNRIVGFPSEDFMKHMEAYGVYL